jgi:hypothetical protein
MMLTQEGQEVLDVARQIDGNGQHQGQRRDNHVPAKMAAHGCRPGRRLMIA